MFAELSETMKGLLSLRKTQGVRGLVTQTICALLMETKVTACVFSPISQMF